MAVPAVAVTLALSGCGQQSLIGEQAIDPSAEQVSAEEAREAAQALREETGSEGAGETSTTASGQAGGEAAGPTDGGGSTTGTESSGQEATTSGEPTGSGIADQALAELYQEFPVLAAVPPEQLRPVADEVCTTIASQGPAAAQSVLAEVPGVAGQAQLVVDYMDAEVCP